MPPARLITRTDSRTESCEIGKMSVPATIGANSQGFREVLGVTKDKIGRGAFLKISRATAGARPIISGACPGPVRYSPGCFPEAAKRMCVVPLPRVLDHGPDGHCDAWQHAPAEIPRRPRDADVADILPSRSAARPYLIPNASRSPAPKRGKVAPPRYLSSVH